MGSSHWAICPDCELKWHLGTNLLPAWQNETDDDWCATPSCSPPIPTRNDVNWPTELWFIRPGSVGKRNLDGE